MPDIAKTEVAKKTKTFLSERVNQLLAIKQVTTNDFTKIRYNIQIQGFVADNSPTGKVLLNIENTIENRIELATYLRDNVVDDDLITEESLETIVYLDSVLIQPLFDCVKKYLETSLPKFIIEYQFFNSFEVSSLFENQEKEHENASI